MQFVKSIDYDDPGAYLIETLKSLETSYNMRLTIHDLRGLLFRRDGQPFLPRRNYHAQDFCTKGRYENPQWNRRCMKECSFTAESVSLRKLQPFIHHCWKGCSELIVPVEHERKLILVLYAGVFRPENTNPPRYLTPDLCQIFKGLPVLSKSELVSLSRILQLLGHGMLYCVERYRKIGAAPPSRKGIIRKFIDDHSHEPVKIGDLARFLYISPSRTVHLVTELFGMSFQELLLEERMTRARNLLLSTSYPTKEIAVETGYKNVFYFNRVFRNFYGIPPGRFRAKNSVKQ